MNIEIKANNFTMQKIYGVGALVSTPTGSTAFNLSAGGPIVKPEVRGLIVSEILDHNLQTPTLITDEEDEISLTINGFRPRGTFTTAADGETVDVVLRADTRQLLALQTEDKITIHKYKYLIDFVDFGDNYFLRSLQKHFGFK